MKYGIKVGQIYIAADGSQCGHLVTDITTHDYCDDVVTVRFNSHGWASHFSRIDSFKLAMVRYYLADQPPEWMPRMVDSIVDLK